MHQQAYASITFERYRQPTCGLEDVTHAMLWAELAVVIDTVYPKAKGPWGWLVGIEQMLLRHCPRSASTCRIQPQKEPRNAICWD